MRHCSLGNFGVTWFAAASAGSELRPQIMCPDPQVSLYPHCSPVNFPTYLISFNGNGNTETTYDILTRIEYD